MILKAVAGIMKKRLIQKGLTIIEALITLLVMGITLSIVSGIAYEYSHTITFVSDRDKVFSGGAQIALEKVGCEVGESIQMIIPSSSETNPTSELNFKKIDQRSAGKLPSPYPSPSPSPTPSWNPSNPAYVVNVKYYLEGGILIRKAVFPDQSIEIHSIADNLSGFSAQNLGDGSMALRISYLDSDTLRTLSTQVFLRNGQ